MSASGRKRTLIPAVFGVIERPLSGKADIRLELVKRAANDPKRTYRPVALQHKSWAELTDDRDLGQT